MLSVRAAAAKVIAQLLAGHGSLSTLLPIYSAQIADNERSLLQELCFGTCRFYPQLNAYTQVLLEKPLRAKDTDIRALLLLGLYQLQHMRIPDHAAISETVEASRELKKPWATNLINGVLRQFQRNQHSRENQTNPNQSLKNNSEFTNNLPAWLAGMLRKSWPEQFTHIIAANDQHPPFTLRINTHKISREEYQQQLAKAGKTSKVTSFSDYGITLDQVCDPRQLPGFDEGLISVQDEAAQLCVDLMQLSPHLRVLDACCAPGGKTGHMLEREPSLHVTALDLEERRLERVRENLTRLGTQANILCGDANQPETWWDGKFYDRILLDAPCSATGIIRRHPDIKILRTPDDIARLTDIQTTLLNQLWPLLKPGGILLYATCSILPKENSRLIEEFLQNSADAKLELFDAPIGCEAIPWGIAQPCGRQLLPQSGGHDGFFYARLRKTR